MLLTALVSGEERERVMFLYRRMARGEITSGSAQVSITLNDGTRRVLQLRATGRCDTTGVVRHIDGVVSEVARSPEPALADGLPEGRGGHRGSGGEGSFRAHLSSSNAGGAQRGPHDPLASASMELSHELLRESSQHFHTVEPGAARHARRAQGPRRRPAACPPR